MPIENHEVISVGVKMRLIVRQNARIGVQEEDAELCLKS